MSHRIPIRKFKWNELWFVYANVQNLYSIKNRPMNWNMACEFREWKAIKSKLRFIECAVKTTKNPLQTQQYFEIVFCLKLSMADGNWLPQDNICSERKNVFLGIFIITHIKIYWFETMVKALPQRMVLFGLRKKSTNVTRTCLGCWWFKSEFFKSKVEKKKQIRSRWKQIVGERLPNKWGSLPIYYHPYNRIVSIFCHAICLCQWIKANKLNSGNISALMKGKYVTMHPKGRRKI